MQHSHDALLTSGMILALHGFNRTLVPAGGEGCFPHPEYLDKVLESMGLCAEHRATIKEAVLMEKK